MWGQAGDGGGFVNSSPGGGFDSNAGKEKGPQARRGQNIMPVTIKQLVNCTEDTLKIEDVEASVITIVGVVRHVETSTTKVTFILDDSTATIEAIHYAGTDSESGSGAPVILVEGTYGRVIGGLRSQKGSKYIIIYKVFPVTDMNELTCHQLEVMQVPLKLRKMKEEEAKKTGVGMTAGMNNTFSNSMVGSNFGAGPSAFGTGAGMREAQAGGPNNGLTVNQNKVLAFLKKSDDEDGVHVDVITKALNMNPKESATVLEFLSGEGHIYSTIDDDHYKVTQW